MARYPFPMPTGRDDDDFGGDAPRMSLRHRLLLALPHLSRDPEKAPLGERIRGALVKPVEPGSTAKAKAADKDLSIEELEDAVKYADDKERLTGLLLAPIAGAIGLLVIGSLISNDPPALLKNGSVNPRHVDVSLYHTLTYVLLGLAIVMLGTAFYRKRLFLGIAMALYGLSIFNLHYWGFGVPFVLVGAWLLVRAYRLQRDLREATGDTPSTRRRGGGTNSRSSGPQPNKRYTPRTAPTKRTPPKPENEQKAG
jgi:hypothetical protein